MPSHPYDDDPIKGGIGSPVPATTETVSISSARRCRNRTGATELGECSLGTDPFVILTNSTEELGTRVKAYTEGIAEFGAGFAG